MKRIAFILIGVLLVLSLGACGGGGGGSNTTPPTHNSNWDQMTWDQDNWA